MNIENILIFISIAFVATITPGPAIMLVSANSVSYGVQKSIITILGNITGLFLMSLLAILGLSTIILSSAPIFLVVKIVGALYLIYLGIKLWYKGFGLTPSVGIQTDKSKAMPKTYKLYVQGLLIALSNPKAIAFTTALFPQFIDPSLPLTSQFLILIVIFMFLSFSCLLGYAALAAKVRHQPNNQFGQKILSKIFASIFVGSGIALVFTSQK